MFSFSTCWNSESHTDGERMLDEIFDLGFSNIELSHGIRIGLFEGIERAVKNNPELRISSLHNFCPLPVGYMRAAPNVYLLSSPRESERQKALRHTLQTMDFAVRMKAPKVILHFGAVPMRKYSHKLEGLIHDRKWGSRAYKNMLEKALAERASKSGPAMLLAMKSLEELAVAAMERKIFLCIECRQNLEEMPNRAEFDQILNVFGPQVVGYWHDSGHAQTQQNMGIIDHQEWLEHFSKRLVGGHLHDVRYPSHDHCIPGDGMISFDQLLPLRRPDVLKVFEFEPGIPAELLKESLPPFMRHFEFAKA